MSPVLRFFAILAAITLVVCIGVNAMLGPPGYSEEYLDEYKTEHDHYLEIVKSPIWHRYEQRPELHGPGSEGAPENFQEYIDFYENYVSREEFQREQARRAKYDMVFDFFNASMVVLIAVRFGRKPLIGFLDAGIVKLRAKVREAEDARLAAEARKRAAEEQMAGIPDEGRRAAKETEERLERELAEVAEVNQKSIELMEADSADRRQEVSKDAAMLLKRELVDAMLADIEAGYRARNAAGGESNASHQASLIDAVAGELEKRT